MSGSQSEYFEDDELERDDEDELGFGREDCGRWRNGRLTFQCLLAGTEDCDWECPIGLPSRSGLRRKSP